METARTSMDPQNTQHVKKKKKRVTNKSPNPKRKLFPVTNYIFQGMVNKPQDLLSQIHTGLVCHRYKCTFYHT